MTEKQFKLFIGKNYGVQKVDGEVIFDSIISMAEADVLVDLLNDLIEEKEQLKSEKKDMQILINTISDQRNEFHRGVRENANRVGKLEKENEQLEDALNQRTEQCDKYYKENKQLKAQLYCNHDGGVCSICKHCYLEEQNLYYISKCKKGHEQCSKVDVKYCDDFELKGDLE